MLLLASVTDGGGLVAAVVSFPANDLVVAATGVGAVVPPSSAEAVAVAAPVFDVELPVPAGVVAGCSLLAVSWWCEGVVMAAGGVVVVVVLLLLVTVVGSVVALVFRCSDTVGAGEVAVEWNICDVSRIETNVRARLHTYCHTDTCGH